MKMSTRVSSRILFACAVLFACIGFAHKTRENRNGSVERKPIELVELGDRVATGSRSHVLKSAQGLYGEIGGWETKEIDAREFRTLRLRTDSGARIKLLRPLHWIKRHASPDRSSLFLSIPECNITGPAKIESIGECPPIQKGNGQVVTGWFEGPSNSYVDISILGAPNKIGATLGHPFWSETRGRFIGAGALRVGELVITSFGERPVTGKIVRRTQTLVYNIEVMFHHVYRVGELGALVHNPRICPQLFDRGPDAPDDWGVVYVRTDMDTGLEYVGQAEDWVDFRGRMNAHARDNAGREYWFEVIERVDPRGRRTLDAAEEDWIRVGGGPGGIRADGTPHPWGGPLENKRWEMGSEQQYRQEGGTVDRQ